MAGLGFGIGSLLGMGSPLGSPLMMGSPLGMGGMGSPFNQFGGGMGSPLMMGSPVQFAQQQKSAAPLRIGSTVDSPSQQYKVIKELGNGYFGTVYKMQRRDGKITAVKVQPALPEQVNDIRKECKLLRSLRHPNIVSYFEHFNKDGYIFIVMEFCGGGTLKHLIKSKKSSGGFRSIEIYGYCLQLAEGLAYIHECGVVHRDLKSENIMLTNEGNVKITDFGRGKIMPHGVGGCETFTGGDQMVIPPEFTQTSGGRAGQVSSKYDMWGFGCIMSELITMKLMREDRCSSLPLSMNQSAFQLLMSEIKKVKGGQFHVLMDGLLQWKPEQRVSAQKVREAVKNYLAKISAAEKCPPEVLAQAPKWGITGQECERIWTNFQKAAKSGNNYLSVMELHALLLLMDVSVSARTLMGTLGKDKHGIITFEEFAEWWGNRSKKWIPTVTNDEVQASNETLSMLGLDQELFQRLKKKFATLDDERSGTIPVSIVYNFLVLAGIKVTGLQMPAIQRSFGADWEEQEISFNDLLLWWKSNVDWEKRTYIGGGGVGAAAVAAATPLPTSPTTPWKRSDKVQAKRSNGTWEYATINEVLPNGDVNLTYDSGNTKILPLQFHAEYLRKLTK